MNRWTLHIVLLIGALAVVAVGYSLVHPALILTGIVAVSVATVNLVGLIEQREAEVAAAMLRHPASGRDRR